MPAISTREPSSGRFVVSGGDVTLALTAVQRLDTELRATGYILADAEKCADISKIIACRKRLDALLDRRLELTHTSRAATTTS